MKNELMTKETANALALSEEPKTLSILILDGSGSMQQYGAVPQECVNRHFYRLQSPPDGRKQYCTVLIFNDRYQILVPITEAQDLLPLTTYSADGNTLLFETVYQAIKAFLRLHEIANTDIKIVVGVFSDGDDTASDKPRRQPGKVQAISKIAQQKGWELLSFGIGIDAKELARSLGFPDDDAHTQTVENTPAGLVEASDSFTTKTTTIGFADPRHFKKGH